MFFFLFVCVCRASIFVHYCEYLLFFCLWLRRLPRSTRTDTPFPYTTRFLSGRDDPGRRSGRRRGIGRCDQELPDFGVERPARRVRDRALRQGDRSEEHTSKLQSLMRISYAVFCLKKKKTEHTHTHNNIIDKITYNSRNTDTTKSRHKYK